MGKIEEILDIKFLIVEVSTRKIYEYSEKISDK